MLHPSIYPLPSFLSGRVTQGQYCQWLDAKAKTLFKRDRKRGKAFAFKATEALYKSLIHLAVVNSNGCDPYTGEKLAWELISTWTNVKPEHPERLEKKYALLPTIDHCDPDVLEFEICSWRINTCKNYLTPKEFVALCKLVSLQRG